MDELEISGKRFISSKRAAKENRYHTDYIGQLIRSGKVTGSKVGRTWYVEEESLAKYLGQPYQAPTTPAPSPEIFVSTKKHPEPIAADTAEDAHPDSEITSAENKVEEYETVDPIYEKEMVESVEEIPHPVSIMKIHKEDIDKDVQKFVGGGLRYIEDDEPLLPRLGTPERKVPVHVRAEANTEPVPSPRPMHKAPATPRAPRIGQKELLLASIIVGAVAFFGSVGLSYFLTSNTTVDVANASSSLRL